MYDPNRTQRNDILAGNSEPLDRLYNERDILVKVLRQISLDTFNGRPSLAASAAIGVLVYIERKD